MAAAKKALLLLAILFAANVVAHAEWLDEELDDNSWNEEDEQDAEDDGDPSGDTRYKAVSYTNLLSLIFTQGGTRDTFHCTASGKRFRKGFAYSFRSTGTPQVQWRVWAHQECQRGAPTRVRVAYRTPAGQWMHITNTGQWTTADSWSSHPKLVNAGAATWTTCTCPAERRR